MKRNSLKVIVGVLMVAGVLCGPSRAHAYSDINSALYKGRVTNIISNLVTVRLALKIYTCGTTFGVPSCGFETIPVECSTAYSPVGMVAACAALAIDDCIAVRTSTHETAIADVLSNRVKVLYLYESSSCQAKSM